MKAIHSPKITAEAEADKKIIHDSIMNLAKNFPLTEEEKRKKYLQSEIIKNTKSF